MRVMLLKSEVLDVKVRMTAEDLKRLLTIKEDKVVEYDETLPEEMQNWQ